MLTGASFAQSTISGTVKDATSGVGMPGVYVIIKGSTNGTATDLNGKFTLKATTSDTLIVKLLGYKTQEILVGNQTAFDVQLEEDQKQLEEVVVLGYGEQDKRVATGAISKVGAKQLEGYNVSDAGQALQGQVSGVMVNPSSGSPGAGLTVLIRGIGTNGSAGPLIIVDGMIVERSGLSFLNPLDIESIDILKDAASSSIYGARGANGVIIVTTKKGSKGKAQLTYSGFQGVSSPWKTPKMMGAKDYVKTINEKFQNAGIVPLSTFPAVGDDTPDTDWFGEIISPAPQQNHQVSVSRGGENGGVYFSLGYFKQEGAIGGGDKSYFEKWTSRLNTETKVNDYVKIGQNLSFTHTEKSTLPENNSFGSTIANAIALDPITEAFDAAKQFGFGQSSWVQKEYFNPLSQIHITNNRNKFDNLTGNAYIEITPIEGLKFRSDMGIEYVVSSDWSFAPSHSLTPTTFNEINDVFQGNFNGLGWRWENYVTYDKTIDKHHFNVVVGTNARKRTGTYFGASSQGIPEDVAGNPNFQFVSAGVDTLDLAYGGDNVVYTLNSYFGRVIYDYDQKYLFTATLRRDGSSRFGLNKRYGVFPSVSAGWVISDEDFWSFDFVNLLKARVSWGINGNDGIPELGFSPLVSTADRSYFFGKPSGQISYLGASPVRQANPNLQWEESEQLDIGLEIQLLQGSLSVELDYYSKTTNKLLGDGVVPDLLGVGAPIINSGSVRNRGLEIGVNYRQGIQQRLQHRCAFQYDHP